MSEREHIERADTLVAPSELAPSFDLATPVLSGRYHLQGLLGTGGMGAVYRVRDIELGEIVALKMLRPDWGADPSALERFRQEVRLARRVTHRNVARTFDIGEHHGERFLTMECVEGTSLAAMIADGGPLAPAKAVAIAVEICAGLTAAHEAEVVHRDLKPENVLIARDGRVVVTDFGIAHAGATSESAIIGTPAYMAPEQLVPNAPVDARADIFALGAVLYEMLTGERAYPGESTAEVLAGRARKPEPPDVTEVRASVPADIGRVVARCMATSPGDRFESTEQVAEALGQAATIRPPAFDAPSVELPKPSRTGKTVAVLPLSSGGHEEDAYIAAGLTDDLIDTLSMTRGLLVRPRGVVARYLGTDRPPSEVGRELGVRIIVEGSVRRVGDSVRVGVRAIGVDDGFQLWARKFEAPLRELLVVADTAAVAIADALTSELPLHEQSPVSDPAAIELYMRGKEEYRRSWHSTAARAAELLDQALALAPTDPRILAACAMAHVRSIFWGEGDPEVTTRVARDLALRAVRVAPDLGDTWAALASFHLNTGDAVEAARFIRQGLTRAPNFASLQEMAGMLLSEVGAIDEAIARHTIALDLDPTRAGSRQDLARLYVMLGDGARADAQLDAIEPGQPSVSRDVARVRLCLWRKIPMPPVETTAPKTFMRLSSEVGRDGTLNEEQRAFMLRRVTESTARLRPLILQRNAEIYAAVGDKDAAFQAVEQSVAAHLIDLAWMDRCPLLEGLKEHPRWLPLYAVVKERARLISEALRKDHQ